MTFVPFCPPSVPAFGMEFLLCAKGFRLLGLLGLGYFYQFIVGTKNSLKKTLVVVEIVV